MYGATPQHDSASRRLFEDLADAKSYIEGHALRDFDDSSFEWREHPFEHDLHICVNSEYKVGEVEGYTVSEAGL